jgi:uncharacterized membrane protein
MRLDLEQAKKSTGVASAKLDELDKRFSTVEKQVGETLEKLSRSRPAVEEPEPEPAKPEIAVPISAVLRTEEATPEEARPKPLLHPPEPSPPTAWDESPGEAEVRFGQKWLLIAGVTITVVGIAYFLKYSFEQNWVTPFGRVSMAYLTGIGLLAVGDRFRRKDLAVFGLYLIGGGIATLYSATFAGAEIYDLMPQSLAFLLMVAVTALAGFLSLVHDTKWLAVLGLIGGFLTPVVLRTSDPNQVALMSYMTVLNAGILSIAFFKRWNLLNNLGFLCTWLLFSAWTFGNYSDNRFWITLFFLNVFFLIYALVPFSRHFISDQVARVSEFAITLPNAFIALGFSYAFIAEHFSRQAVSVATIAYATLFMGMAHTLYRRNPANLPALVMLLGKASVFLVITVPLLFSGNWITLFWAIEAVVLLWAASRLENKLLLAGSAAILGMTLWKFFCYDYRAVFDLHASLTYFRDGYANALWERWITIAAALGSVFSFARLTGRSQGLLEEMTKPVSAFFHAIFALALFGILNIEVSAFFHDYYPFAQRVAISVLWAVFSICLMVIGFAKNLQPVRICSIALFSLTAVKVFFLDMADVAPPFVSLIVLGALLIGASYPYHRFSTMILEKTKKEER